MKIFIYLKKKITYLIKIYKLRKSRKEDPYIYE